MFVNYTQVHASTCVAQGMVKRVLIPTDISFFCNKIHLTVPHR